MEEKRKKKILLLCVTSQNVITFRAGLIKALQNEGFQVSVIAFDDEYLAEIKELNVDFYCVKDTNRSLNPLRIVSLKRKYRKLIREIKPDKVFTFMLKPNTIGVKAAKAEKIKDIYCMVEGAGDAFIRDSLKWKVLRWAICKLYKSSFKNAKKVFFLNNDDKSEFLDRKLVVEEQCAVVKGIGVDLKKFEYKPLTNYRTFLMIARMIRTKGIFEYCKAARIVKEKYPDVVFNYIGAEGDVKIADIQEYIDEGIINYLGTTKDVRPYIEDCAVYLLPSSYREGLPMSIMEAEATGRVIITTLNIGCTDTVKDGYNGFLVEKGDYQAIAEKMISLIENPDMLIQMGTNAREFAEGNFDSEKINNKILQLIV